MGGGAQPAGTMGYPPYIENAHESLLSAGAINMLDAIEEATALNPYQAAYSYDPVDDLAAIDARFDELVQSASAAEGDLDWQNIVESVVLQIDQILTGSTEIDDEVEAFEAEHAHQLAASQSRVAAGMADINAVNSSAFPIAMALLEDGFNTDVAKFRGDLRRESRAQRAQMILMGTNSMVQVLTQKVDISRLLYQAQVEKSRMAIVANKEYLREEISLAEHDATWNLDMLKDGSGLLGAVAGVGMRKAPMPAWASGLSGAMGGAAAVLPIAASLGPELGTLAVIAAMALSGAAGLTQGTS